MILCLINNIFACANMLLGAAAVISAVYVDIQASSSPKVLTDKDLACTSLPRPSYSQSASRYTPSSGGLKQREFQISYIHQKSILTLNSFLTDYFHTAVILIIACYFSVKAFSDDQIGSVGNLFELLKAAAERHPVSGNQDGTYLTMTSKSVSIYLPFQIDSLLTHHLRRSSSEFFILAAILDSLL